MFANTWNIVIGRLKNKVERSRLIRDWNESAQEAFVNGSASTMLKSSISRGEKSFKHQFSNSLNSGFRISILSGQQLSKNELTNIGTAAISDSVFVRKLIALGFDTLEICGDVGTYGCRWRLKDYI